MGVESTQMAIPDTTPVPAKACDPLPLPAHPPAGGRDGAPTPAAVASRRALEDWCRSHLGQARCRQELMALAAWDQPCRPGRDAALRRAAAGLRGEDLLVDLGRDRYLLVLPRTARAGAEAVLERLCRALGPAAVGATLWNPRRAPDRDETSLVPAIRRAQAAVPGWTDRPPAVAEPGVVVWSIPEPVRPAGPEEAGEW